jgi:outer membrane biosynthesis protein TonB
LKRGTFCSVVITRRRSGPFALAAIAAAILWLSWAGSARAQEAVPPSDVTLADPVVEAPPPTEEAPPPTEEAPPPTEEAPPPTEEAPPPTEEAPPPTQEAPPPTEEAPPPTEEAPPPAVEAPPPASEPLPPEGAGSNFPSVPDASLAPGLLISDGLIDPVSTSTLTIEQLVTMADQTREAEARKGAPNAGNNNMPKEFRAPLLPFEGSSDFSASGGVMGAGSSGAAFGVAALLLAVLLVVSRGRGNVVAMAVAPPRRTSLVLHVERPG